jgi:hypothetical protein
LKLNTIILITIFLSLRREREGEGDKYYLKLTSGVLKGKDSP